MRVHYYFHLEVSIGDKRVLSIQSRTKVIVDPAGRSRPLRLWRAIILFRLESYSVSQSRRLLTVETPVPMIKRQDLAAAEETKHVLLNG